MLKTIYYCLDRTRSKINSILDFFYLSKKPEKSIPMCLNIAASKSSPVNDTTPLPDRVQFDVVVHVSLLAFVAP